MYLANLLHTSLSVSMTENQILLGQAFAKPYCLKFSKIGDNSI